ncbi:hypothetical protein ANCCAN_00294 [Ancylostoma caninum]|uniref:SXP/RAL-2 family protein Ani s 5-like cation-binding domain-containing protein n=2 Tax=Ancylostoma TaxID=29169 RepID=A0A368HEG7_ANCCA|nr:hypothetical protein ANCCAN_00294 [Ancylostoma caninum]
MKSLVCLVALPILGFAYPPRLGDPFSPLGPWTSRGPPCGLPPFVEKLPEDAQEQVRAIWSNYKEGEDCMKEHKQTRDILHELPEEVREKVMGGKCGPSFLRNVSSTVRREFRAVWFDHRLTLEAKELTLKRLAYSLLNGESLALYIKWEEELQLRKKELEIKISALSPAAKEAYEGWKKLRMQEKLYLAELPKEIREELRSLCGWRKREEPSTEAPTTTSTEAVQETTQTVDETTTAQPMIEEKTKEVEFAAFLDVSMPEELNNEAQCSYYA